MATTDVALSKAPHDAKVAMIATGVCQVCLQFMSGSLGNTKAFCIVFDPRGRAATKALAGAADDLRLRLTSGGFNFSLFGWQAHSYKASRPEILPPCR